MVTDNAWPVDNEDRREFLEALGVTGAAAIPEALPSTT